MTKLILTVDEAELLRWQHEAVKQGDIPFGEMIMPNGKCLKDCTLDYAGQIGEALVELSRTMESHQRDPETTLH
jgi:hypothetical protein